MFRKILFASSLLALAVPAGGALAQGYYGYGGYSGQHAQDHEEHGGFHDEVDEDHAEAHAEGFYSRRDHRTYHRALRDVHGDFHDDHPNTRHDGYGSSSRQGGGYYGYQSYGGYPSYGSRDAYRNGPSVTYSYGRRW